MHCRLSQLDVCLVCLRANATRTGAAVPASQQPMRTEPASTHCRHLHQLHGLSPVARCVSRQQLSRPTAEVTAAAHDSGGGVRERIGPRCGRAAVRQGQLARRCPAPSVVTPSGHQRNAVGNTHTEADSELRSLHAPHTTRSSRTVGAYLGSRRWTVPMAGLTGASSRRSHASVGRG